MPNYSEIIEANLEKLKAAGYGKEALEIFRRDFEKLASKGDIAAELNMSMFLSEKIDEIDKRNKRFERESERIDAQSLSPTETFIATALVTSDEESKKRIEEYKMDKKMMLKIKNSVANGKALKKDAISFVYLDMLRFCCTQDAFEKAEAQLADVPKTLTTSEYVSRVESIVGPILERREENVKLMLDKRVYSRLEEVAAKRNVPVKKWMASLSVNNKTGLDEVLTRIGISPEVIKSIRQGTKEMSDDEMQDLINRASERTSRELGSMSGFAESALESPEVDRSKVNSANRELNKRENTKQKEDGEHGGN